jgi:hypothetical protein
VHQLGRSAHVVGGVVTRKAYKPTLFWAVMVGDHLLPSLPRTRDDARSMLAGRRRLEKLRPELCPEKGRARVVRVLVQIAEAKP